MNATNEIIHSLTYFPSADYFGQDSFVIRVSDGIDQDLFTFDFEVQDVPDTPALVDLDNDSVEDGSLYQKTISFSDPDGLSDVTHSISGLPGWVEVHDSNFTNGTITLSGSPEVADEGLSQVTVLLTDGNGFQVSKSFSLSVYVLNYPPVFASDTFSITMTEDLPSSWVSPFFEVNDTETLLGNMTWSLSSAPGNGQVSLGNDPQSDVVYVPDGNFSGSDTFTIMVTDRSEKMTLLRKASAVVNVTVSPVNDQPVFTSLLQAIPPKDIHGTMSRRMNTNYSL